MRKLDTVAKRPLNAIWLSDIHLGYNGCRAEFVLDFLVQNPAGLIYLAGEVKDCWVLAPHIKNRVANARAAIRTFETAAAAEAARRGLDGIICGHIHQPEIRVIDDILYCNDGDWVKSCTALVEHHCGRLELVHWSDLQQAMKCDRAVNDDNSRPLRLPSLAS